jgi:hypothetical protein
MARPGKPAQPILNPNVVTGPNPTPTRPTPKKPIVRNDKGTKKTAK